MQIAGSKPSLLVPAAEIIGKEFGSGLDFVDINCGCPIDLVYQTGSGSARKFLIVYLYPFSFGSQRAFIVLDAAGRLGKIVVGMNKALGDVPVTVKLRTGVKDGRNNAHKLMPRLACEWPASALTVSILSFSAHCSSLFTFVCMISSTVVLVNKDIRAWQIGTILNNVSKLFAPEKRKKTVSFSVC